jgi:hypothetical protein
MAVLSRPAPQVLIPVQREAQPLAPLLPIQRDRRGPAAAPVRRVRALAVAVGASVLLWLAVVGGVLTLGRAL